MSWLPIATGPQNATWVLVKMADGDVRRAHWASDLSGSEQPPFQGWFVKRPGGFESIDPVAWMPEPTDEPSPTFDLIAHLERQREFSLRTFGPGPRTEGVIHHIRKELSEIAQNPKDLFEWVDVILLGLDGAWRAGFTSLAIAAAIAAKQAKNEQRKWPDWRTVDPNKTIGHIKDSQ